MHACLSNEACCCYTHSLGGCNKEFTHMNKKVVLSAGDQCIAEEVDVSWSFRNAWSDVFGWRLRSSGRPPR